MSRRTASQDLIGESMVDSPHPTRRSNRISLSQNAASSPTPKSVRTRRGSASSLADGKPTETDSPAVEKRMMTRRASTDSDPKPTPIRTRRSSASKLIEEEKIIATPNSPRRRGARAASSSPSKLAEVPTKRTGRVTPSEENGTEEIPVRRSTRRRSVDLKESEGIVDRPLPVTRRRRSSSVDEQETDPKSDKSKTKKILSEDNQLEPIEEQELEMKVEAVEEDPVAQNILNLSTIQEAEDSQLEDPKEQSGVDALEKLSPKKGKTFERISTKSIFSPETPKSQKKESKKGESTSDINIENNQKTNSSEDIEVDILSCNADTALHTVSPKLVVPQKLSPILKHKKRISSDENVLVEDNHSNIEKQKIFSLKKNDEIVKSIIQTNISANDIGSDVATKNYISLGSDDSFTLNMSMSLDKTKITNTDDDDVFSSPGSNKENSSMNISRDSKQKDVNSRNNMLEAVKLIKTPTKTFKSGETAVESKPIEDATPKKSDMKTAVGCSSEESKPKGICENSNKEELKEPETEIEISAKRGTPKKSENASVVLNNSNNSPNVEADGVLNEEEENMEITEENRVQDVDVGRFANEIFYHEGMDEISESVAEAERSYIKYQVEAMLEAKARNPSAGHKKQHNEDSSAENSDVSSTFSLPIEETEEISPKPIIKRSKRPRISDGNTKAIIQRLQAESGEEKSGFERSGESFEESSLEEESIPNKNIKSTSLISTNKEESSNQVSAAEEIHKNIKSTSLISTNEEESSNQVSAAEEIHKNIKSTSSISTNEEESSNQVSAAEEIHSEADTIISISDRDSINGEYTNNKSQNNYPSILVEATDENSEKRSTSEEAVSLGIDNDVEISPDGNSFQTKQVLEKSISEMKKNSSFVKEDDQNNSKTLIEETVKSPKKRKSSSKVENKVEVVGDHKNILEEKSVKIIHQEAPALNSKKRKSSCKQESGKDLEKKSPLVSPIKRKSLNKLETSDKSKDKGSKGVTEEHTEKDEPRPNKPEEIESQSKVPITPLQYRINKMKACGVNFANPTPTKEKLKLDENVNAKLDALLASKLDVLESDEENQDNFSGSDSNSEVFEMKNEFLDDMAEEGEEDTPSEGSNDIVDEGESINTTESEADTDESYDHNDSFIVSDEDPELLPGEEYDLDDKNEEDDIESSKKSDRRSRIIQQSDSSDEELSELASPRVSFSEKVTVIQKSDGKTEKSKNLSISKYQSPLKSPRSAESQRSEIPSIEVHFVNDSDSEEETEVNEVQDSIKKESMIEDKSSSLIDSKIRSSPNKSARDLSQNVSARDSSQFNTSARNSTEHNTSPRNSSQHNVSVKKSPQQHNTSARNSAQHNASARNSLQHNTSARNSSQHNASARDSLQHNTSARNSSQNNTSARNSSQHNTSARNSSQHNSSARASSIIIHENVRLHEIQDGALTEKFEQVVKVFCCGIKAPEANVSVNVSLDYVEDASKTDKNLTDVSMCLDESVNEKSLHKVLKPASHSSPQVNEQTLKRKKEIKILSNERISLEDISVINENQCAEEVVSKKKRKSFKLPLYEKSESANDSRNALSDSEQRDSSSSNQKKKQKRRSLVNLQHLNTENVSKSVVLSPRKSDLAHTSPQKNLKQDLFDSNLQDDIVKVQIKCKNQGKEESVEIKSRKTTASILDDENVIKRKRAKRNAKPLVQTEVVTDEVSFPSRYEHSNGPKVMKKLTSNLIKEATSSLLGDLVTDVKNRPRRLIKPSGTMSDDKNWIVDNNIPKLSRSNPPKCNFNFNKIDEKDFRNRMLYDPRIKRETTSNLLKKKGYFI